MSKPIVVVGSVNLDLVTSTPYIPSQGETILGFTLETFSGGKGANQAVAVARLGGYATMIGAVGNDASGETLKNDLRQAGVDVTPLTTLTGTSGTAIIIRGNHGENAIIVVSGANASLRPEHIEQCSPVLAGAGMILLQLEIPMETVEYTVRKAAEMNIPVMLDPAPACRIPDEVMRNLQWLTPNETEQRILLNGFGLSKGELSLQQVARILLDRGARNVVLKLGSQGVYMAGADCEEQLIPSFPVNAVDTTAAGDVFNAAFAVSLSEGNAPTQAARFAAAASAIAVTRLGAQAAIPTREEVLTFLSQRLALV